MAKKLRNGEFKVEGQMTEVIRPSYDRAPSPPIPTVAKRLRDKGCNQNHSTMTTEMMLLSSNNRPSSPPIPTVAKRLRNQEIIDKHDHTAGVDLHLRSSSPPVPTVAKRLQ